MDADRRRVCETSPRSLAARGVEGFCGRGRACCSSRWVGRVATYGRLLACACARRCLLFVCLLWFVAALSHAPESHTSSSKQLRENRTHPLSTLHLELVCRGVDKGASWLSWTDSGSSARTLICAAKWRQCLLQILNGLVGIRLQRILVWGGSPNASASTPDARIWTFLEM